MSLSAIAFLLAYVTLLGLTLLRGPAWGLAAYFLAYYRHPPSSWWGQDLPLIRWSFIAAWVMVAALAIHGASERGPSESPLHSPDDRKPWYATTPARLLLLLCAWMWLQTAWAIRPTDHLEGAFLYTKFVVLFAVLYQIINSPRRMETLFWFHVLGCFLWGLSAFSRDFHGRMELDLGPEGGDSNTIGYHLGTGVAFAGFLFVHFAGKRRWTAAGMIPFILNGVMLTASRSAILSLLGGGVAAFALRPRQKTWVIVVAFLLSIPLGWRLSRSELIWDRLDTLKQGVNITEGSAASRIPVMYANLAMFRDHPFGVGYRGNMWIAPRYLDERYLAVMPTGERVRSAHNTFLAYLVDQGVPGGLFLICITFWAFRTVFRLRRLDRDGLPPELSAYRAALGAAFTMHFTASLFINLQRTETWLWMLAALAALEQMSRAAVSEQRAARIADTDVPANPLHPPYGKALPARPQTNPPWVVPASSRHLSTRRTT